MSYQAIILLPPGMTESLDRAESLLRTFFANSIYAGQVQVTRREDQLLVIRDDWLLRVAFDAGPHVLEESHQIATLYSAYRLDKETLTSCDTRFDVWSDPDPDMDYFNDYALVIEQLSSYPGAIVFDPQAGIFI